MRQATILISLLIHSLRVGGQPLRAEQLVGTWIGVHYGWDTDYFVPIGSYWYISADGSCQLGALNQGEEPIRQRWSITNGALRLDTLQFRPEQVQIDKDLLRVNGYYPLTLRRFRDVPLSMDSVRTFLQNTAWTDGAERYHFHANGQACLEYPATYPTAPGDRTVHQWTIVPYQQSVFLVVKGVENEPVGNYQPIIQLMQINARSFTGVSFDSTGTVRSQTYRLTAALSPDSVCRPIGFQPCVTYLYRPVSMYYSYDQKGHQERLYYIRKIFGALYKSVRTPNQSGLIRIRFQVNCRGEAGRFDLLELDSLYQRRSFDQQISRQIVAICRQSLTTGWLPAQSNRNSTTLNDYIQFITIRLKDGVITEIFP